jgi:hypothetical protein
MSHEIKKLLNIRVVSLCGTTRQTYLWNEFSPHWLYATKSRNWSKDKSEHKYKKLKIDSNQTWNQSLEWNHIINLYRLSQELILNQNIVLLTRRDEVKYINKGDRCKSHAIPRSNTTSLEPTPIELCSAKIANSVVSTRPILNLLCRCRKPINTTLHCKGTSCSLRNIPLVSWNYFKHAYGVPLDLKCT